ncbi:hypothetical protein M9435_004538 [Picochlorum sp. BPE23]|nr:hypothetical protein M9435_004538 [Picochlorum sp. BPE23]
MNLTKRALPADLEEKRIHFHNWNLDTASGTNEKGWVRKTIQEIVSELDHLGRTIQVFKIDCEGCEYGVIPQVIEKVRNGQLSIEQIHIEMHGTDAAKIQKIFQTMRSAGYAIFHKERNHWGCNGYSCVEYAFISMEQAKKIFKSTHCLRFQMIEDQEQLPEDCKSGELYGKQCSVWTNSREEVNVLPILYGGPFNQIIGMKSKLCLLRDYSGVLNLHIPPVQPHYSRSEDKPVDLRSHFDFKGMYHNLIFWNTSNEDFVFEKCIFLIDMPTISGDLTQRKPYFLRTSAIMLIRCVQEDVIQTSTADMTSVLKQHSLTNKRLANSLYIILGFHFGQDRCLVSLGPTLPHDGSKSFDSLKGYQRHNAEFLHAHDLIQPVFRCTMSEQRFVAVHLRVTDRVEDAGNSTHACLHLNGAKCDLDKTKLIKFRDIAESIEWISTDLGLVSVYLFSNQIEFVTTGLSPYMKLTNFVDDSCASLEPGWNQLACQFQAGCSATLFVGSPSSTISATLVIERSTKPSIFLHQLISIKNKRSA